jgi:hypothetical protein
MKALLDWKTEIPNSNYYNTVVLITCYLSDEEDRFIEIGYINENGHFENMQDEPFPFKILAYTELPHAYYGR